MLYNFNYINFTSLKIRGGILKNVAFRIEKKSGNTPGYKCGTWCCPDCLPEAFKGKVTEVYTCSSCVNVNES